MYYYYSGKIVQLRYLETARLWKYHGLPKYVYNIYIYMFIWGVFRAKIKVTSRKTDTFSGTVNKHTESLRKIYTPLN